MPQLNIPIHGKTYTLACAEGEEQRLRQIAAYVDGRINSLANDVGNVGEPKLLLLTTLMLADELAELNGKLARGEQADGTQAGENQLSNAVSISNDNYDALSARIDQLTNRLQQITEKVSVGS